MAWLEFTNPPRSSCTHKWARGFDIRYWEAIETEWLDPSTGAAFAVISSNTRFSFRVGYGAPGTEDVVDITNRLGRNRWRFSPEDAEGRAKVRDDLRKLMRSMLADAGGVFTAIDAPNHAWKVDVDVDDRDPVR